MEDSSELKKEVQAAYDHYQKLNTKYHELLEREKIEEARILAEGYQFAVLITYPASFQRCSEIFPIDDHFLANYEIKRYKGFLCAIRESKGSFDEGDYYILIRNDGDIKYMTALLDKLAIAQQIITMGQSIKANAEKLTGISYPEGWTP